MGGTMLGVAIISAWIGVGGSSGYLLSYPGSPYADGEEWIYACFGAAVGPFALAVVLLERFRSN
jgi:hypothetical protein